MSLVRRAYVYGAALVSLEAVGWALIDLLRNVLAGTRQAPVEAQAFQMAVIVVGLPFFLAHWRWAGRLAQDEQERASAIRRLYLYGLLTLFLIPLLANVHPLLTRWLTVLLGGEYQSEAAATDNPAAIVVLVPLWLYHWRVILADRRQVAEMGRSALVRRTYVLGFSAAGVVLTGLGLVQLLRWVLVRLDTQAVAAPGILPVSDGVARLVIGLLLWVLYWRWAEALARREPEERGSALRHFYLYAGVFVALVLGVTQAAMILAGFLRQVLGLEAAGDIREPLSVLLVMAAGWLLFGWLLRREAARWPATPRQAGIRRLYRYLVAAVGLTAFVFGLGGVLNVVLAAAVGSGATDALKEQLAWSTALLAAGLVVWLPPWRRSQRRAAQPGPDAAPERASVVRKLYLYFFLFLSAVTVLSGAVAVVALILIALLGAEVEKLTTDLPRALAYGLVAVGVWAYHGLLLRRDGELAGVDLAAKLKAVRVVVVDTGDGRFGRAVLERLKRVLPELAPVPLALTPAAAAGLGVAYEPGRLPDRLREAGLIVGPWRAVVSGAGVAPEVAAAVASSPAPKLLAPTPAEGWEWAGVDRYDWEELVTQVVGAVRLSIDGEPVRPVRPLGAGAIIALTVGLLLLALLVGLPIIAFMMGSGLRFLI